MISTVTVMPSIDIVYQLDGDLATETVIAARERRWYASGKGINVARGVRDLGGEVRAFTLGGGITGRLLGDLLTLENIPCEVVHAPFEIRVNATIGAPNGDAHVVEPSPALDAAQANALRERVLEDLPTRRILAICGHCPAPHSLPLVRDLLEAARRRGVRAILDTRDEALRAAVDGRWAPWLLKPNLQELSAVVGRTPRTPRAIVDAAREVLGRSGCEVVLVSLGRQGAVLVSSKVALLARAPDVRVRNTVGAGDAMVAAAAVFADRPWPELLAAAVAAGSADVASEAPGAVPADTFAQLLPGIGVEDVRA